MPHNATRRGTMASCEASLRRLKTDRLDMYLLHWRGSIPLDETLEAFDRLQARRTRFAIGASATSMLTTWKSSCALTSGAGTPVATNQVLYNLMRRGIEYDLLPWSRTHGIPLMAYSPLEQGLLAEAQDASGDRRAPDRNAGAGGAGLGPACSLASSRFRRPATSNTYGKTAAHSRSSLRRKISRSWMKRSRRRHARYRWR